MAAEPQVLWTPRADGMTSTRVGGFVGWLDENRGVRVNGYDELWQWSVSDLEGFWGAVWEFFEVRAHAPYEQVLSGREMPGAQVVRRGAAELRRARARAARRTSTRSR